MAKQLYLQKNFLILDNKYNKKIIVASSRNQQNRLYQFYNKTIDLEANLITIKKKIKKIRLWYKRYRHINYIKLQYLSQLIK